MERMTDTYSLISLETNQDEKDNGNIDKGALKFTKMPFEFWQRII